MHAAWSSWPITWRAAERRVWGKYGISSVLPEKVGRSAGPCLSSCGEGYAAVNVKQSVAGWVRDEERGLVPRTRLHSTEPSNVRRFI